MYGDYVIVSKLHNVSNVYFPKVDEISFRGKPRVYLYICRDRPLWLGAKKGKKDSVVVFFPTNKEEEKVNTVCI